MWFLPRKLSGTSLKKEREHVKHNEHFLKETVQNPDYIKEDNEDPNVYFYIKKAQKYQEVNKYGHKYLTRTALIY